MRSVFNDVNGILFSDFLYKSIYVVECNSNEYPQHMFLHRSR